MYQTRAQALEHLRQLQQQQQNTNTSSRSNNNNKTSSSSSSSMLIPASRWLARRVHQGCIKPIHFGQATISGDPTEDGVITIRSDTSDGKRLANVMRLRSSEGNNNNSSTKGYNNNNNNNSDRGNQQHFHDASSFSMNSSNIARNNNNNNASSSSSSVAAICSIPRDRQSAPGEIWVAWSNGKVSVLNEPGNKVLATLPSIASTCGSIVALIPFFQASVNQHRVQPQSMAANNSGGSISSTTCDGGWLFGRNSPTGRSAVIIVTSSGTLLCLDTRTRSLMFRVPPSHTPRSALVKCASALTDDSRAIILLATENCFVHALELKISNNGSSRNSTPQKRNNNNSSSSSTYVSSTSTSSVTCSPRIIQTLSITPPGTKVELECCPLCISTSTPYLRDPSPTVFVGFLTGHACFFKIIFTGSSTSTTITRSSSSRIVNNNINDDDNYMLLYNQSHGMTLAHEFGTSVVAVCPIYHSGRGCITVSSKGACVFSIDAKVKSSSMMNIIDQNSSLSPSRRHQREAGRGNNSNNEDPSQSLLRIGWKPVQRVENNFHSDESFPIGGTALSSNEIVLLLSDGGLRRLLVANEDPDELDDDVDQQEANNNTNRNLSPSRRGGNNKTTTTTTTKKKKVHHRKKVITVTVKRQDPVTGQERDVEENVEVDEEEVDDEDDYSENDEDGNEEGDFFPPTLSSPSTSRKGRMTLLSSSSSARPISPISDHRRNNNSNNTIGNQQRPFHDEADSEAFIQQQQGHGFWGSSSRARNRQDGGNNNVFSRLSKSPTRTPTAQAPSSSSNNNNNNNKRTSSNKKGIHFDSSGSFLDHAMSLADSVQKLYIEEDNHRQLVEVEEDNDLGFFWHLHKSGLHGKDFIRNTEQTMKKLFALQAEEREARMKNIVTSFYTSMTTMMITQTIARRKVEQVILCERQERDNLFQQQEDQFHLLYYLMSTNPAVLREKFGGSPIQFNSTSASRQGHAQSSSSSSATVEMLEKQVSRERAKNETITREHQAMKDTVATLQTLLKEEQQRGEMLRKEVEKSVMKMKSSNKRTTENDETSSLKQQVEISSPENVILKDQVFTLQQRLNHAEKQLIDERMKHEKELEALMEENRPPPPQQQHHQHNNNHSNRHSGSNNKKRPVSPSRYDSNDSDDDLSPHHRQIAPLPTMTPGGGGSSSRLRSPQRNNYNNNNNNTTSLEQLLLLQSPTQQQFTDTRRSLEDETIRRSDAERSLDIISKKCERLTSLLAESETESREHRTRADFAEERLHLVEKELEELKIEFKTVKKSCERYEDLARKFEGEFSLRDEQYNKAARERDFLLKTSDDAVATVEEQQRKIRQLSHYQEGLRKYSRKLLALCDISVSVGSEPPAMSSLRKFLRELMMECATLKRYDMMPQTAVEKVTQLYDRTTTMQDHLFSVSNPAMVVLDKSEAVEVMTNLRSALED